MYKMGSQNILSLETHLNERLSKHIGHMKLQTILGFNPVHLDIHDYSSCVSMQNHM